jgi:ABC-type polysaccharide/polyol phosphate transport system ATPase subunit
MRRPRPDDRPDHVWALRDVSFKVDEGEILGIIGRNGAGKSTLFLVLSQILAVDEGTVDIRGEISTLLTISAGFRGDLTGLENIHMSASLLGLSMRKIREIESEIIAFAELEEFIDEPIKTYSTGMKARLGFAIAVHVHPDILLMDEVLSVGDESFRVKSQERIHRLLGSARAILIVSHNLEFIRSHCSRAIWIEGGTVREDGQPEDVVRNYIGFCTEIRKRIEAQSQQ